MGQRANCVWLCNIKKTCKRGAPARASTTGSQLDKVQQQIAWTEKQVHCLGPDLLHGARKVAWSGRARLFQHGTRSANIRSNAKESMR